MKLHRVLSVLLLLCAFTLGGCAAKTADAPAPASTVEQASADEVQNVSDDEFEDYDDEDEPVIADPLEPWNRFWFEFNDVLLLDVAKPVYKGYETVTPKMVRTGLSNFWHNLRMPVRFINRLLQGEFAMAVIELDRFIVNTTLGLGGLVSYNEQLKPLVPFEEYGADFGNTLRKWGFGEGCYIVWPFLGPSTVRDSFGMGGDYVSSPLFWGVEPVGKVDTAVGWAAGIGLRFNDFGDTIKAYETLTDSAVEPYSALRDAYVKSRRIEN